VAETYWWFWFRHFRDWCEAGCPTQPTLPGMDSPNVRRQMNATAIAAVIFAASYADPSGREIRPTYARVARAVGLTGGSAPRRVGRYLDVAIAAGWLLVVDGSAYRGKAKVHRLTVPEWWAVPEKGVHTGTPLAEKGVHTATRKGFTSEPPPTQDLLTKNPPTPRDQTSPRAGRARVDADAVKELVERGPDFLRAVADWLKLDTPTAAARCLEYGTGPDAYTQAHDGYIRVKQVALTIDLADPAKVRNPDGLVRHRLTKGAAA
jgi:hypothetical protein